MRTFENYFVFFMTMLGMLVADSNQKYQQFYNEMLDVHNEYRAMHNAKPLYLDKEMCEKAIEYATSYKNLANRNSGYNISFKFSISELNARNVFLSWYDNGTSYTYVGEPVNPIKTDSFTQIVWQKTEKMGVAVLEEDEFYIVLVTYSPRGNKLGQYSSNVFQITEETRQVKRRLL